MRSMAKWSSASCTVIAALTTLIPLRKRTTSCPSREPVVKATPFTDCVDAPSSSAWRIASSGAKAETTAMRGVSSRIA